MKSACFSKTLSKYISTPWWDTYNLSQYEHLEKKFCVLFECKFCSTQQPGLRRGREKENTRVSSKVEIKHEKRNETSEIKKTEMGKVYVCP